MANLFQYGPNNEFVMLNISATVGKDGANLPDDVYLVQILLRELYITGGYKPELHLLAIAPIPNGVFDKATAKAIEMYKEIRSKFKGNDEKVYYKNHLDPIRGSIRAFGTIHVWAIAKMQLDLIDGMSMSGIGGDLQSYLYDKYPQLLFIFP